MMTVPWKQEINFASALLLHSCITVFLKEVGNSLAILQHLATRGKRKSGTDTSIVLDGYTSIFSKDHDGELAELYFTNTGIILLMVSLASAIAMNLALPIVVLNIMIAATFGLAFIASALVACRRKSFVMPIMALRRAGRFIWSDTPDYITFRSIAILELVFMKARLAAADVQTQQTMLKRLLDSEYVFLHSNSAPAVLTPPPPLEHQRIVSFTSTQHLFVMLCKTAIGHADGSVCGVSGPATIPVPNLDGFFVDEAEQYGYRIYRVSPVLLALEDCGQTMVQKRMERTPTKERKGLPALFTNFIAWTHGVLLRRLGRHRVVWMMRVEGKGSKGTYWRGNVNLVTGLKKAYLENRAEFQCVSGSSENQVSREIVR
ncbi:hypothetical protein T440DRAFT_544349 [Plenodomus tracheiphilus IPT5]|uniref:Uncharacterized protein n=1 Tax=Plenodomus tracheiphilus IPT5 TaxID=1408161 RepID=A0A6A7BJ86_9PLEO|nr:hypothetical protein T440DRAFT_544349 [Plenodomus tracheiphilus IPT5]